MTYVPVPSIQAARFASLSQKTSSLLVLLHGFGSGGQQMARHEAHLRQAFPELAVVVPDAPLVCSPCRCCFAG